MMKKNLIAMVAITCFVASVVKAGYDSFVMFSDDFETSIVEDGTSANWEKFPASATTCSLYSYEDIGLGGTGDAALMFANGGGFQLGCMRTKSSAWTAPAFTPNKITLSFDYKYLNQDVARMVLANSSDLSNSYGIYLYPLGLGSGQMVLERIASWPNAQNSVSGFSSTELHVLNFNSTAYFNQTGEWNRVVVDLDILADRTDITMTWSSLQQTHGNTLVLTYSDTSANRLTNVSTLGFLGYRGGGNLSPFVDNVRVEAAVVAPVVPQLVSDIDGPNNLPDYRVDLYDLKKMAGEWLDSTEPVLSTLTGDGDLKTITRIVAGDIVVDGNLSEWNNAEWINLDKVYYGSPLLTSAKCAVYWVRNIDNSAVAGGKLYVAVLVEDADIVLTDDNYPWDGSDRVEFYIKGNADSTGYYQSMQDFAQQYVVGIKNSNNADRWIGMGNSQELPTGSGFDCAVSVDGNFLKYEAVIPIYDNYGYFAGQADEITSVFDGKLIGFDVVVDDKTSTAFGMVSENLMTSKSTNAARIATYTLDGGCLKSDINQDFYIDFSDFSYLASEWLKCVNPDGCD